MGRIAQVRPKSPPKSKKIVDQVHEILLTLSRIEGAFEALFRFGEAKMVEQDIGLIAAVRAFNRRYTRTAGLLDETLSRSAFSLAEARVLFELGERGAAAAVEIAQDLGLDPAYLARILRGFAGRSLLETASDPSDGRRRRLTLTSAGQAALAELQSAADREVGRLIAPLDPYERSRLGQALDAVSALLTQTARPAGVARRKATLRPHRAGDIGWIVSAQGRLYAGEYGWDASFEALVAEICAAFLRHHQPGRDFCWIAELDGLPVGAVMLVHEDQATAKLRLLHVEAFARGHGIGRLLVERCVGEARRAGYLRLTLWTNDVLVAARRLYERAGFRLTAQATHHSFGQDLVGQTFELDLTRPAAEG